MEYKKIINDNYRIHIINSSRFKTISIVVFLTKEFNKDDIVFGSMLCQNILFTSKKYNTKAKMAAVVEDLYGAKISGSFGINGKCETFVFSLDFLNPKYTNKSYLNKTLNYFKEVLFNPNINNNEFNIKYFNLLKKDNISSIKSIKDDSRKYASIEYAKIMYKRTPSSYTIYPEIKDLEKLTSKELYNHYKELFNDNFKIDVFIHGEVDDNIIRSVDNMLKDVKGNNKKLSLTIKHKYDNKLVKKIDSGAFNQSRLYVGYRLINLNNHELNHVLRVYNTILGTMNDSILFNVVREANSLCYSIGSYYSKYNPSLTIYAGINKTNYENTVKLIKECVESMKDRKTIEKLFEFAKKTINTYLNNYYDDLTLQINNYYDKEFELIDDVETLRDYINKVTIDEVIELNKKIKLSTIYMLKGDN